MSEEVEAADGIDEDVETSGVDELTPRDDQQRIIDSDAYPMRVLAGAGTGKTFTMVRKVERLIEEGVPPERILALTFTNKAADAMREKLVERVGSVGYDIEAYTYHAICHELLGEFAYYADLDPRYDIATDADQFVIAQRVLDEMPYRFTNPDVYPDLDFASGADDRLLGFVPAMKRSGIRPADLEAYLPSPARLIELEGVVERIREAVAVHLRVGWRSMDSGKVDDMVDRLDAFEGVLTEEAEGLAADGLEADVRAYLEAMVDTCRALTAFFEEHRDRVVNDELPHAQKLPAHLFGSYAGAPKGMPKLSFDLPDELETFIEHAQTLSDLTVGYRAYERELRAAGLLDFNDLVLETVAMLPEAPVADWLAERYDYVFCDEYQDTDHVQFDLVRELLPDDRLFVVGDDDQAIYEWRGAEVANIGPRLDDAFANLTDYTLEENFRSNQPILDLANAAIRQVEARGSDKQLQAVDERATAETGVVTIDAGEEPEDEAEQIANVVTRLLAGEADLVEGEYAPGDVAILVRKRKHARPIVDALRRAGIPYELGGDLAGESPGIETVVAALKALADPADEVSLNRVLRMRYRLCEEDLKRLNTADPESVTDRALPDEVTLQEALLGLQLEEFDEPDRVETARKQFGRLLDRRDTVSLARLYRELKSTLRLEWFLSAQDRRDLKALDELVASFEDGTVQPELSAAFIEYLANVGPLAEASDRAMEDQPEADRTAVSIMTVHKSKGLEFPVVILPQLRASEWKPRARTHDVVEYVLHGGRPTDVDFAWRDAQEARRLLHVAITRSEDLCVLVGRSEADDDAPDDEVFPLVTIAELLPESVPWDPAGVTFPIWGTVQSSLPPTAVDGTDTLAAPVDIGDRVAAIDGSEDLARAPARERVFELAEAMLAGELSPPVGGLPFEPDVLVEPGEASLLRRHSYTSLDTLEECPRRYYLDYVVRAFDDPPPSTGGTGGPSPRVVGLLFHATAERASERGLTRPDEWRAVAERIATVRGEQDGLEAVSDCIDRYFRTEVADWDILDAERRFELDVAGEAVVGQIDALASRPDGELVVLDYKATAVERSIEDELQLPIYLLACEELFDEAVRTAGYVYVGEVGPEVVMRTFNTDELESVRLMLAERLERAGETSFDEFTPGKHCQWCPHRSLPCSI